MARSLKVHPKHRQHVKSTVQREGFPRQKDLAEELNLSLATVSNFLNGKPVDYLNFLEIAKRLSLNWQDIADVDNNGSNGVQGIYTSPETGQEQPEKIIYVERPPVEGLVHQTLLQPGSLIRIKAPSLTGKTILIARELKQIKQQGYQTVYLNLHLAEKNDLSSLDKFLRWLCISASQGLGLPNQLAQYWDEKYSTSKVNCTDYFEQYLLAQLNSPLVLCLDEVDRVFPYPELAQEFLSLLRAWHEQAKIRNIWKNLRLVIVHSTEVYIPLNINESPFNVGLAIELPEFNPGQVLSLAQQYELNWSEAEVKQLMDRVGGHPHLIEQALSHLRTHRTTSLSQLLAKASTNEGIYKDHLRRVWVMIQRHPDLVEAMRSVVTTTTSVRLEIMQAYKLHSIGLVSLSGSEVFPRCALYQEYFCNLLRDAV